MTNNQIDAKGVADLLKEFERMAYDYARPNSDIDIGDVYYFAGKIPAMAELIAKQDEALRAMRENLRMFYADTLEYMKANGLTGSYNYRKSLKAVDEVLANSLIGGE